MNVLLLSNSAPNYHYFFNYLVERLSNDDHQISIAVDSIYSKVENNLDVLGFPIYEFSEFFSKHKTDYSLLVRYNTYNLNAALLSDFERAETYHLWKGNREQGFFDRLKSALLAFFEMIVKEKAIEVFLYEGVSNAFSHFALFVSKENNIKYKGLSASRLPGRFSITEDPFKDHEAIQKRFKKLQSGELIVDDRVRDWCENYLNNIESMTPDYMKFNNLDNLSIVHRYANIEKVRKLFRVFKYSTNDHYHSFQVGNPVNLSWQMLKRAFLRRIKSKIIPRYYDTPREEDQFLLYPLHFHPEASTSILAGAYINEYEVIRNIAFNLPEGTRLYVKDHISAYGYPTLEFYKKISLLPNVKLLAPQENTKELIKASLAVITLTSTVGYEALLLNKKVFLYGHVFYKFHSNVLQVNNSTEIYSLFMKHLYSRDVLGEGYNVNFLIAYYLSTYEGRLNLMQDRKSARELVDNLYGNLVKIMLS